MHQYINISIYQYINLSLSLNIYIYIYIYINTYFSTEMFPSWNFQGLVSLGCHPV